MLKLTEAIFVLIDVQGKLAQVMHERDALFDSLERLVKGMQALQVPILWMEQIPEKMGPTLAPLAALLAGAHPIPKTCFSCWGSDAFREAVRASGARQVVLAGIETHVCVYQTAVDLVTAGYRTEVVTDAVSSRTAGNKQIGLDRIKTAGAFLTSVEMVLFELMGDARHNAFRTILSIVK